MPPAEDKNTKRKIETKKKGAQVLHTLLNNLTNQKKFLQLSPCGAWVSYIHTHDKYNIFLRSSRIFIN